MINWIKTFIYNCRHFQPKCYTCGKKMRLVNNRKEGDRKFYRFKCCGVQKVKYGKRG